MPLLDGPRGPLGRSKLWALHVFKQWLVCEVFCDLHFKRVVFPLS
jgi:hypothetical protein